MCPRAEGGRVLSIKCVVNLVKGLNDEIVAVGGTIFWIVPETDCGEIGGVGGVGLGFVGDRFTLKFVAVTPEKGANVA